MAAHPMRLTLCYLGACPQMHALSEEHLMSIIHTIEANRRVGHAGCFGCAACRACTATQGGSIVVSALPHVPHLPIAWLPKFLLLPPVTRVTMARAHAEAAHAHERRVQQVTPDRADHGGEHQGAQQVPGVMRQHQRH